MLVAVAHYPEGAGHATRMLAVARALEARGASVRLAGGGPGARFARLNGYEEFEPTRVAYVDDVQTAGSLTRVARNSLPASARRVRDYVGWLSELDPAALVTDDMFAAVAAGRAGVPLFVLTHNAAFLYDGAVERTFTRLWTVYLRRVSRAFLYPAVWPPVAGEPRGVVRIPPVALEADDGGSGDDRERDDVGVLAVPSHYSPDAGVVADRIAGAGHAVTRVGGEDWEPVPSLMGAVRAADAVVCSGYSTVMEAAVAGTPCVVYPHTDEQRGVARTLAANAVEGFAVAADPDEVLGALADPPGASPRENGAGPAAECVLGAL